MNVIQESLAIDDVTPLAESFSFPERHKESLILLRCLESSLPRGFTSLALFFLFIFECLFFSPDTEVYVMVCVQFTCICLCDVFLTSHMESSNAWIQNLNHSINKRWPDYELIKSSCFFPPFLRVTFENTHIRGPSKNVARKKSHSLANESSNISTVTRRSEDLWRRV